MSDKRPHQNKRQQAVVLTPEQQVAAAAEVLARQAAAKEERARIELYGKSLPNMSFRQLRGELHRTIKREYSGKPPSPQAGLSILYGTVLLTVLENTKTRENPWG